MKAALRAEPDAAEAVRLLAEERLLPLAQLRVFLARLLDGLDEEEPLKALRRSLYFAMVSLTCCRCKEKDIVCLEIGETASTGDGGPDPELGSLLRLRVAEAESLLGAGEWRAAERVLGSVEAAEVDYPPALPLRIALLVHGEKEAELFALAHRLVDAQPKASLSWSLSSPCLVPNMIGVCRCRYAVGAYYYLLGNYEAAKKLLKKAQGLGPGGAGHCWLLLGHAFAMEQEHDQAISSYLKVQRKQLSRPLIFPHHM